MTDTVKESVKKPQWGFDDASPAPWTYRSKPSSIVPDAKEDWIEDTNGNTVVENVGRIDGPMIVEAVNSFAARPATPPQDTGELVEQAQRLAQYICDVALIEQLSEVDVVSIDDANAGILLTLAERFLKTVEDAALSRAKGEQS